MRYQSTIHTMVILAVTIVCFSIVRVEECRAQNQESADCTSSNAEDLLELAGKRCGELSKADRKLFKAVGNGTIADFTSLFEDNDPAKAMNWGKNRILKADRIEWLCTDPEASAQVTRVGIWIKGALVDGKLDLRRTTIPFPLLIESSFIPNGINLMYAEINTLLLAGSHTGPIKADYLRAKHNIMLSYGYTALGEVRLLGAQVGGELNCAGGRFINPGGYALMAQGLTVGGGVHLRYGFRAEGEVCLGGARIGGPLDCSGGHFINPGNYALSAEGINVEGNVFMSNGFKADGMVNLLGSKIARLAWCFVDSAEKAILDLSLAEIGTLLDEEGSWPKQGNLFLDGLVYERIDCPDSTNAEARIEWLRLQPSDEFWPQPYEQLAEVYRKSGREEDAKKVLIAKNEVPAKLAQMSFFEKSWHTILGVTIGYGYSPFSALWFALAVVVFGFAFFGLGFHGDIMVPTQQSAYVTDSAGLTKTLSEDYPKFNALVYSLDMFVPLVDLHQANFWLPNAHKGRALLSIGWLRTGSLLNLYHWFHIIAGWVLTTLLVVGLSGLVRK